MPYPEKDRKKDWRKSGWAKAADAGLYAASRFHPAASLAYDGVGALTGFNTEKKYFDVQGSSILANGFLNAGSGVCLTDIQPGTDGDQRTGISVKLTDFQIRFFITPALQQSLSSTFYSVRIFLLYDREGNVAPGTAPALADILQDASTADRRWISPLNVTNFGRFQILKDHHILANTLVYNPGSGAPVFTTNDTSDYMFDWTFGPEKLHEHHLLWDDPAGSNPTRGHIYLYAMSTCWMNSGGSLTQDTTTNNQPFISYWARSRFVDN
nr:capsid protein [Cressdnaviricota sp.]